MNRVMAWLRRAAGVMSLAVLGSVAQGAAAQVPDLSVSGLTVGAIVANPNGSWTIPVSYTVTNVGTAPAPASFWYEKAYLSSDAVLDNTDPTDGYLGYRQNGLEAGASYTVNANFTTSPATAPGSYTVIVKTDGMGNGVGGSNTDNGQLSEANEANNTAGAAVTLSRPDLSVSGLTVGAIVPNPNGSWTIPVSYTVKNIGAAPAPASFWYEKAYLSGDAVLDNADATDGYLGYRQNGLEAGASYTVNASFTTSPSTAPGSYTVIVKTDGMGYGVGGSNTDNGQFLEANEANNTAGASVTLSRPDLSVSGLTLGAIVANPNGSWTIPVSYTVTNIGSAPAPASFWYEKAYLSGDAVLDNADATDGYLGYRQNGLEAGASYTVNASFTTTPSTLPGSYTLIVKTDGMGYGVGGSNTDNGQFLEANEANNTAGASVTLSRPDLSVSGLSLGAIVANANGSWTIPVSYTVTNVGTAPAPASFWYEKAYLSSDAVLDNADPTDGYLGYRQNGLEAGASYTVNASFTTSPSTAPGSYTLIVKTDGMGYGVGGSNTDNGQFLEANEANNTAGKAVTLSRPDLAISGLTVGVIVASTNGSWTIPVSFTVTNVGTVAAPASIWYEKAYLSSDAVLDNADETNGHLGYWQAGLPAGGSYVVNGSFTTSTSTAPGSYQLFVKTDGLGAGLGGSNTDGGQLAEASETNNAASVAVTLVAPGTPTTTTLTASANPITVGQAVTLSSVTTGDFATGTVTFRDGATVLGAVPMTAGGAASLTVTLQSAGNHSLTALYGGDSSYAQSTSSALVLGVGKVAEDVSLAVALNPAYQFQGVTLVASVDGFLPTGTVTFMDGATVLGSGAVSGGKASAVVQFQTAGNRTVVAAYSGDDNNAAANSPGVLVQIMPGGPLPVSPAPVVRYEYDAQGNQTKAIEGPGVAGFNFTTQNGYDRLNRVSDTLDAKSGWTQFGYDGADRLLQVTDPRSLVTQTPRNGLGDVSSLVSPDTGTTTNTYDAAGNLLTKTDARGVLATFSYDALNRLTSTVFSKAGEASQTFTRSYDETGAGFSNGIGRLTSTTHPAGSSRYSYDAQGRLLTETQTVLAAAGANSAPVTTTVTYTYDAAGHLTSILYPSGRKLVVTYVDGQINAMALAKDASSQPVNLITDVKWEPFGGVKSWQWQMASGTQLHDRVYDSYGRVIRYRLGADLRDLTYDAGNRITAYTHYDGNTAAAVPALDQSFGYDELGRLTGITLPTATWSIGYDANGNRTGVTLNGLSSAYTTPATSNRLSAITNPARSFTYDAAGNTTADTYAATYNLAGRMATLAKGGVTTTYSVDGDGRRVRKFSSSGAGSMVVYVYDQNGRLLGEYDSSGVSLREYVWLGATPIAVFVPDSVSASLPVVNYIHADHLGTPRLVVSKNGQQRWNWLADPFGVATPDSNPQGVGSFTFNLRAPGQYADAESGLVYNFNRDYDATSGRYVQSDPIGLAGGVNTYTYAEGNPITYADPLGLVKWSGEMYAASFAPLLGGGVYNFDLRSECVKGKYAYVHVRAWGVGAGVGAKITGGVSPGTVFNDGNIEVDPNVFNGTFQVFSVGAGAILTGGWSFMRLGEAFSTPSWLPSPAIGLDLSAGAFIGKSKVWKVEIKDCSCNVAQ